MAIKVSLGSAGKITRRSPTVDGGKLKLDRATYQKLGSLVQNRTLTDDYNNGRLPEEYTRLLDELNNLYLKKNYPILHGDLEIMEGIEELDEYLGSLGVTEEYPYSKDFRHIPVWMTVSSQTEYRVLMDEEDNTYLTDGDDVFVAYTGE